MRREERKSVRASMAALSLLTAALLTACGGGGGEEAPPPTVVPESLAITAPTTAQVAGATQFGNSAASLSGLKYSWDFGDGASSSEANPSHSYVKGGDYEVVLRVSNALGSSRETRFKITVNNFSHVSGLVCSGEKTAGWCWQQPRPTGTDRYDTFFLDASTGWSVGGLGEIFKTSDAGVSWVRQPSNVDVNLSTVRFVDANNGWALGDYRALLRTTDGGASWRVSATDQDFTPTRLQVLDGQTLALRDYSNNLRISTDGGKTLRAISLGSGTSEISPNKTIWVFNDGVLSKSTDLGLSLKEALNVRIGANTSGYSYATYEMKLVDDQRLLVKRYRQDYSYATGIWTYATEWWQTQDSGASWTTPAMQGLPAGFNFNSGRVVHVATGGVLLMSEGSRLYRSADTGNSWTSIDLGFAGGYAYPDYFLKLSDTALLYYRSDAMSLSEDNGLTWTRIGSPGSYYYAHSVRAAQMLDAQTWHLTMSDGVTYRSTNKGKSWAALPGQAGQSDAQVRAFWAVDAKRAQSINGKGELLESKDGGLSWQVKLAGLSNFYNPQFSFVSAKVGWLALGDGRLYRTVDGGETWVTGLSMGYGLSAHHFLDENNGFAAVNGRLMQSKDGGLGWVEVGALPNNVRLLRFHSVSRGIALGYGGIYETRDGGVTWVPRFTGSVQDFSAATYADANNVWALGSSGSVLHSSDGGETWRKANIGATTTLNAIQFLDAKRGWAVGTGGAIFATVDGGKTWQLQTSGTNRNLRQVQFVDSKTGWVLGDNGALLATGTGGN